MTAKPKKSARGSAAVKSIRHYYNPLSCILCQDIIAEQSSNISFFRMMDLVTTQSMPIQLPLWLIAEFEYNDTDSYEDYKRAGIEFELRMLNPKDKTFVLVQGMTEAQPNENMPRTIMRLMLNMSGQINFGNEGKYTFEMWGKTNQTEMELLTSRFFIVRKAEAPIVEEIDAST